MNKDFLVVLTGTITPSPGALVSRSDPALRRADYLNAFKFWLDHPDSRFRRILFAENSGADLAEFRTLADQSGKEVEIIQIPPNPPPPRKHYGYSELQMIDLVLAKSKLRKKTTHMIKATGRLTFPALPRLLDRLPENFRFVGDARARLPFRPSERGFVSVQLFLTKHDFYDQALRTGYHDLTESYNYPEFLEHLFFERLTPLKGQDGVLLRFPINCEPVGIGAHWGMRYDNPKRVAIAKVRAFLRVVAPDFWF